MDPRFQQIPIDVDIMQKEIYLSIGGAPNHVKIARQDASVSTIKRELLRLGESLSLTYEALFGIVEMEVNTYLVFISKSILVGRLLGHPIHRVRKIELVCLSQQQNRNDRGYIKNLKSILESGYVYFSYGYDLTNTIASNALSRQSKQHKFRNQYLLNHRWISRFMAVCPDRAFVTGFIQGFISIAEIEEGPTQQLALITRRDNRRQGMRWQRRGADRDGFTVNTAETESIMSRGEDVFSYVQLRGSMPFIWEQRPNLQWCPPCYIYPNDQINETSLHRNYQDIQQEYEQCTLVNLIDKKGPQGMLGNYFNLIDSMVKFSRFELIWFDFHSQCRNMKYQNVSKLLDLIKVSLNNYHYHHLHLLRPVWSQRGVVRVNCMDCLDRTNVVQSQLAKHLMLGWIRDNRMVDDEDAPILIQSLPRELEDVFRRQWTENADALSQLYCGTPAMKTDFTRFGRRTLIGSLKDGVTGVRRFVLGNFYDSRKQDYIDFALGHLQPNKSPRQRIRHPFLTSLPFVAASFVAIPFLMKWATEAVLGDEEERPVVIIGLSVAMGAVWSKLLQKMHKLVVRKSIRPFFDAFYG